MMTGLDLPVHPLVELLAEHFSALVEAGVISVVHDEGSDAVEVQADDWTLHIAGWPAQSAFVAVDAETDSIAEHRKALHAALEPREFAALAASDRALHGNLSELLIASGDGLSMTLAEMLEST